MTKPDTTDHPPLPKPLFWIAVLPSLMLLLPILIFPAGPDQSIYVTGAQMLGEGGTYYVDVVDLKPPILHYLYLAGSMLPGSPMAGARLLDYLVQAATVIFLALLLLRTFDRMMPVIVATVFYSTFYVALGPEGTFQPESILPILLIAQLWAQHRTRSSRGIAVAGLVAGLILTVKFTFGVVILAGLITELLLYKHDPRPIRRSALFVGCSLIAPLLFLLWIYLSGATDGLLATMEYIRGRQTHAVSDVGTMARGLRAIGWFVSTNVGVACMAAILVGMIRAIRHPFREVYPLTSSMGWLLLLLAGSAIVELMMTPYQMSRIALPSAILLGSTVPLILSKMGSHDEEGEPEMQDQPSRRSSTLAIVAGLALLVLSPLPRYVSETFDATEHRVRADASSRWIFLELNERVREAADVGSYLGRRLGPDDSYACVSGYTGFVAMAAEWTPSFRHLHGHHIVASYAPPEWKDDLGELLQSAPPRYVVIELNDEAAARELGAESTRAEVRGVEIVRTMLDTMYQVAYENDGYRVYEWRRPSGEV